MCQVYRRARSALGEILSAFEFLDRQALLLTKRELDVTDPLPQTDAPMNIVIETSGSNDEHDMAKLEVREAISGSCMTHTAVYTLQLGLQTMSCILDLSQSLEGGRQGDLRMGWYPVQRGS